MINNQAQVEGVVKEIQSLVENEEILRMKIGAANLIKQKMTEKLENLHVLRKEEMEKIDTHKKQIGVLDKARYFASCHEHSVESDLKRKRTIMVEFAKLVENNDLVGLVSELHEFEKIKEDFLTQKSSAPWLPEKQLLLNELKQHECALSDLQKEISSIDCLISEREQLLALHKHIPFNMFCVTIGNYLHRTKQLNITLNNELKVHDTLLEKIKRVEQQDEIQNSVSLGVEQDDVGVVDHQEGVTDVQESEKLTPPNKSKTTKNLQINNEENDMLMHFDEVFQGTNDDVDDGVHVEVLPHSNFSFGFNFGSPIRGETTNKETQNEETFGFNFNF